MIGQMDNKSDNTLESMNRVYSIDGLSPTINTGTGGDRQPKFLYNMKIRKLTPLESFRLMGVIDEDALKMLSVNSNSQCYKQAGNSIVVDVMVEIFKNLFLKGSEQLHGQMDIYDFIK